MLINTLTMAMQLAWLGLKRDVVPQVGYASPLVELFLDSILYNDNTYTQSHLG